MNTKEEIKIWLKKYSDGTFPGDYTVGEVIEIIYQYASQELNRQGAGESKYPIGGYAPGNYQCTCCICGNKFMGDKRAVQCEPCATKPESSSVASRSGWVKEEKVKLIWDMIQDWQDARDLTIDINEPQFSAQDIEIDLYDWLEKVDPQAPKQKPESLPSESEAEKILRELIELKDLKDKIDELYPFGVRNHPSVDEYNRRKPLAWEAARKLIDKQLK